MSVINSLLNSESSKNMMQKITVLDINDIYTNPLNKAPIVAIEDLILSIKENGLQTPLIVYKKENHCYVLINGERRYNALKKLGYEDVPTIIIDRPENEVIERLMIMDANAQRDESIDYKKQRAKEYQDIYYLLKKLGKIPTGTLKIDWIGYHMNISGRQVQRYLKVEDSKNTNKNVSSKEKNNIDKILACCKKLKKILSDAELTEDDHILARKELENILESI